MSRTSKPCIKCLIEKPLEAFHRHHRMADGHLNTCKECACAYVRQHRVDNPDYYKTYEKERRDLPHRIALRAEYAQTPEGRESHRRSKDKWKVEHPNQLKAHTTVNNALRDGRLIRQPCWVCGKQAQAHHPDYDRPLDVVWLCSLHHKQAHALAKD